MAGATKFRNSEVPRQVAEQARFKVVHGPDRGSVFVISSAKVAIGRGSECDIMLGDLKASRKHFELENRGDGSWALRDLGSANGVVIKGASVRSALIRSGEILTLGETVLEFVTQDAGTRILVAPGKSLDQIRVDEQALQLQRERVRGLAGKTPKSIGPMSVQAAPAPKKKANPLVLVLIATMGMIWLMTNQDSPVRKKLKKATVEPERIPAALPEDQFKLVKSQVDPLVRLGLREFNNGNLLRARQHFDEVLRLQPDHPVAIRYMNHCQLELDRTAFKYLEAGKKLLDAGKLREARGSFQLVINLLSEAEPDSIQLEHARHFIQRLDDIDQGKAGIDDGDKLILEVGDVIEKLNKSVKAGQPIPRPSEASPGTSPEQGGSQ